MAIYVDTAVPDEARQALSLGFVTGITTNPKLLSTVKRAPIEVLRELCTICAGTVFYQLTAPTLSARREEGEGILRLNQELEEQDDEAYEQWERKSMEQEAFAPPMLGRLGLKIPASTENMALVSEFSDQGMTVAVTAVFSLAQAYVACEARATYLVPYVNRITRLRGDGLAFVSQLARLCEAVDRGTEILAASIKTPEEAVETLLAGAHHVSLPLPVILAMGQDPLSEQAVAEFARASASG